MSNATGSKGMLATEARRRSVFGTLVDLYKSDLAFRGMTDFAVIGGLVMMFIHPPQAVKWPWTGWLASFQQSGDAGGNGGQSLLGGLTSSGQGGGSGGTSAPLSGTGKPASSSSLGTGGPVVAIPFAQSLKSPRLGIGFLFDIDPKEFARSKPEDRGRLDAARRAVMLRVPDDIMEALRPANGNDPNVALLRGAAFAMRNTEASNKSAEVLWRQAAASGSLQAKALLGRLLLSGRPGINQDTDEGRRLIEEGAAAGDPQAMRFAGIGYLSGDFGTLNPVRAAELLKQGADAGDAMSMAVYARMLAEGIGLPSPDGKQAEVYLKNAANAGLTMAQHTLGDWYLAQYQQGLAPDLKDAVDWFTASYEKGRSLSALTQLAFIYAGVGKSPPWNDKKKAFEYVRKCSGFNHSQCQYNSGVGWNGGHLGARNVPLARAHFAIAAGLGYKSAEDLVTKLNASMTDAEKKKADAHEKQLRETLRPPPAEIPLQYANVALPPPPEASELDGSGAAGGNSIVETEDYKVCVDGKADPAPRGEACGRLIADGKGSKEELALAYFGRGYVNYRNKKTKDALGDYDEALKLYPTLTIALNNRGSIHMASGESAKALADFDAALAVDPRQKNALANKAELLRTKGQLSDAMTAVTAALAIDANFDWARRVKARIVADTEKLEADKRKKDDESEKTAANTSSTKSLSPGSEPKTDASVADTADYKLCDDTSAKMADRFVACGRVIDAGRGTPEELAVAWFGRGAALGAENKSSEATAAYTDAIKLNPRSLPSLHNRALIYMRNGDLDKAAADLNAAYAINPKQKNVLAARAELLRRQGHLTEALEQIRGALDVDRNFKYANTVRDSILADLKRLEKEKEDQQAKREEPKASASDTEITALRKRARAHLERSDYDSAIADYTDIIRQDKGVAHDFTSRAVAYQRKGELDQALRDYTRAIEMEGHEAVAHYNRSLIYKKRGEADKALEDLSAAIDKHGSTSVKYLADRADLLVQQNEYDKAVKDYDKVLELVDAKKDGKEVVSNVYLLRGHAHLAQAKAQIARCHSLIPSPDNCESPLTYATALLDYEASRAINPDNAAAHFHAGWIADTIGKVDIAIENYTKAIRADPNMTSAYNNRGVLYGNKRQWELAMADYTDAIRSDPKNKFAWANRGVLFANQRKRSRAIQDLRESLRIDPNYEYAKRSLRRLGVRQ